MKKSKLFLTLLVPLTIITAWLVGTYRYNSDVSALLTQAMPLAQNFEKLPDDIYAAIDANSSEQLAGYVALGEAMGYGGPMKIAAAFDTKGKITNIVIIDHKESPAFFQKLSSKNLPAQLVNKNCTAPFVIGNDVIAVTGATRSLEALTNSLCRASRSLAAGPLNLKLPPEKKPPLRFAAPEAVLISLYLAGFAIYLEKFKYKKALRWLSLLTGLVFLGFLYNNPITLVNINSLLTGYWPNWRLNLYWYLLIAGVILPVVLFGKNPYCESFCPFGSAQMCLAVIGHTKIRIKPRYYSYLRHIQRFLALAAIIVALVYRNPSLYNYEVSGTLFSLTGSKAHFALLAVTLLASLFITRPWCNFLCPIRAVTDYLRSVREGALHLFQRKNP